jgi:predicted MFS family arabinose efflux permease
MTSTSLPVATPASIPTRARAARLSPAATFALLVSIVLFFLAGSSAPTPLYSVYQAAWGFSPITVTVVFGIYAIAVLVTLLTLGSLSDHVGRRPVLIAATAVQAVTMLIFANATSVGALLVARVIQGLSTGAAIGAVGAGLLDLDRGKGTIANAVGPMTGTATGGLLSGLMVQYLPAPTRLIYLVLCAIFVLQVVGVTLMPQTATTRRTAPPSLRPRFHVPSDVRRSVLLAIPALVATWAFIGFYGSLGPALARRISGSTSLVLGGVTLFVVAGTGALTVLALRSRSALATMTFGVSALIAGVALTLVATRQGGLPLFFAGAVLAGAGFGAGFQGAIRTVLPLVSAHERAGVLSVLYVVSYLAMGVPAVIGGVGVVYGGGLLATAREFGAVVIGLAVLALLGALRRR